MVVIQQQAELDLPPETVGLIGDDDTEHMLDSYWRIDGISEWFQCFNHGVAWCRGLWRSRAASQSSLLESLSDDVPPVGVFRVFQAAGDHPSCQRSRCSKRNAQFAKQVVVHGIERAQATNNECIKNDLVALSLVVIVNVLVLVDLGKSSIEECLLTRRLSRTRDVDDEDPLLFLVSNDDVGSKRTGYNRAHLVDCYLEWCLRELFDRLH